MLLKGRAGLAFNVV